VNRVREEYREFRGVRVRRSVKRRNAGLGVCLLLFMSPLLAANSDPVQTRYGAVHGLRSSAGVRMFRGIPYAAPPIGPLRWKAPQEPASWTGVRRADAFGPRCMQDPVFSDMVFRSQLTSEDCLYLNIWVPAVATAARRPVFVYFHGGGFVAGDGSEPRYDGESMARRGIVVVTLNYRLGVFGFLAHPELSREASYNGSGNYGLLDQVAGLRWVHENITAFGGDPHRVTIGGESAGSVSVSALMASPLSRGLISGAIGESGSILGTLPAQPRIAAEANGRQFMVQAGAGSLAELRALRADSLLAIAAKFGAFQFDPPSVRFTPAVDGHFLPKPPADIFAAGEQAHVPLLAGSNSEEMPAGVVLRGVTPTLENYRRAVENLYGTQAEAILESYPAAAAGDDVLEAAQALASDRFTGYSTWKWIGFATRTGGKPTFYYYFSRVRPTVEPQHGAINAAGTDDTALPAPERRARGASHAGEIEYLLGNLERSPTYAWTSEDRAVSQTAQSYIAHFIESGDPNAPGLPSWPVYASGKRLILNVQTRAEPDRAAARGRLFDELLSSHDGP
jgi:para-nitrobenzyl esterase